MNHKVLYLLLVLGLTLTGCTVKPKGTDGPGTVGLEPSRSALVFTAGGSLKDDSQTLQFTDTGTEGLEVSPTISGTDAAQFTLSDSAPFRLSAGQTHELTVTFTPVAGDFGPQHAILAFTGGGSAEVALGGLNVRDQNGTAEPSLQWIFDTYGFPLQTGDLDPATSPLVDEPADYPLGDEVTAQTFVRADKTQPVTVQVLAAFAVPDIEPVFEFGFYAAAAEGSLQKLLSLPTAPTLNGQRLMPAITPFAASSEGVVSFSPTAEPFGFYSFWPTTRFFKARTVYTEDARNTFDSTSHHVRVYPLPGEETTYVLATDESDRLNDFNDAVLRVHNVRPATP